MSLLAKIEQRQALVAVIGLGYVGLPLAFAFAEAGFRVMGIDVDPVKVESLNRGESYVQDIASKRLIRLTAPIMASVSLTTDIDRVGLNDLTKSASGSLAATTAYDALWEADAVIICVPTPLSKTKDPDVSYIINGTTEEIILPRLQGAQPHAINGRRNGKKANGATCPSTLAPASVVIVSRLTRSTWPGSSRP
jgi:UDP-N-acetyl-D-glucosamine dehydrogenase